ncbi:MAG: hypothetical protein ACRDJ1_10175 [Actinomycetota bacterium]
MSRRRLALGLALAAVYLASALLLAGRGPVLPLYDSGPLPNEPYRWVDPPPEFQAGNIVPEGTEQEVAMTDIGTVGSTVVTPDGQAAVVFKEGAFAPKLGEIALMVEIRPLDPDTLGDPPEQSRFDGNAYTVTATYAKDGSTAALTKSATVILRAPLGGTRLVRLQPPADWAELSETTPVAMSLQVFGESTTLGTFVALQTVHGKPFPWLPVSLGASGVAVAAAWYAASRARAKKQPANRRERREASRGQAAAPGFRRAPPKKRKKRR